MYSMLENISSQRAQRSWIDFHMFTDSSNFKLCNFKTACQSQLPAVISTLDNEHNAKVTQSLEPAYAVDPFTQIIIKF